jgi:uncharacterized protein YndB with AHSA1/START domain
MTAMRSIVVEKVLPHSPEMIWRALTDSSLIRRWLMPNDFSPSVGHRFSFTTKPIGQWDGIVHCEVLDCEPHRLLRYSWVGGSKSNDSGRTYGSRLDSTVTWTLTPIDSGTHLRMEHAGFRSPENDFAYNAMSPGWNRIMDAIDKAVGEFV